MATTAISTLNFNLYQNTTATTPTQVSYQNLFYLLDTSYSEGGRGNASENNGALTFTGSAFTGTFAQPSGSNNGVFCKNYYSDLIVASTAQESDYPFGKLDISQSFRTPFLDSSKKATQVSAVPTVTYNDVTVKIDSDNNGGYLLKYGTNKMLSCKSMTMRYGDITKTIEGKYGPSTGSTLMNGDPRLIGYTRPTPLNVYVYNFIERRSNPDFYGTIAGAGLRTLSGGSYNNGSGKYVVGINATSVSPNVYQPTQITYNRSYGASYNGETTTPSAAMLYSSYTIENDIYHSITFPNKNQSGSTYYSPELADKQVLISNVNAFASNNIYFAGPDGGKQSGTVKNMMYNFNLQFLLTINSSGVIGGKGNGAGDSNSVRNFSVTITKDNYVSIVESDVSSESEQIGGNFSTEDKTRVNGLNSSISIYIDGNGHTVYKPSDIKSSMDIYIGTIGDGHGVICEGRNNYGSLLQTKGYPTNGTSTSATSFGVRNQSSYLTLSSTSSHFNLGNQKFTNSSQAIWYYKKSFIQFHSGYRSGTLTNLFDSYSFDTGTYYLTLTYHAYTSYAGNTDGGGSRGDHGGDTVFVQTYEIHKYSNSYSITPTDIFRQ